MADNKEKVTFTDAVKNLEKAADDIMKQSTSLEDSLKLFDEGMKNAKFCEDILNDAEQKIEVYSDERL